MQVWIQNPFDHLPEEGYRKQRYRLMADAFARAGHDVVYFTSDFSHAAKAPRRLAGEIVSPRTVFLPTPAYRGNVSFRRLWSHLVYAWRWYRMGKFSDFRIDEFSNGIRAFENSQIRKFPSLIIASLPTIGGAFAALRLARKCGAKVVIDVQDAWPETFFRLAPRGFGWLLRLALAPVKAVTRFLYRRADLVTGVCDRYRELVGHDDYHRAYLGIEAGESSTSAGDGCSKVGCARAPSARSARRYVYVGALGRSYDLTPYLRKVEADESLKLDIAANGRIATDCPRVRQHGYLDAAALKRLLAECDTGLIPMRDDSWVGVPNKFFDYAAAGLRIETSLGGECAALAARWNRGELDFREELEARAIYDNYVAVVMSHFRFSHTSGTDSLSLAPCPRADRSQPKL